MAAEESQDEVSDSKDTETTAVDTTKATETVDEAGEEDVDFDAAEEEGVVEEKPKENAETPDGEEENSDGKNRKKRTVEFTQTGSLSIKGFKRPLQEAKVREKMESFGPVKHFWMNKTKSACLVTWMSVDDCRHARKKLHGSCFPPDLVPPLAGKLKCEKSDEKNVIFHQNNKKQKPRKNRLFFKALKASTDSIRGASRKRKRNGDTSANEVKKKTKRNLDLATELLLNYCKRTDAKPRIFWKPLTSEEIKEKEKQKRIEEQRERRKREDHQALLRSRNRRSRSPRV